MSDREETSESEEVESQDDGVQPAVNPVRTPLSEGAQRVARLQQIKLREEILEEMKNILALHPTLELHKSCAILEELEKLNLKELQCCLFNFKAQIRKETNSEMLQGPLYLTGSGLDSLLGTEDLATKLSSDPALLKAVVNMLHPILGLIPNPVQIIWIVCGHIARSLGSKRPEGTTAPPTTDDAKAAPY